MQGVIEYINSIIDSRNIFSTVTGLADSIKEDSRTFPAIYVGNGRYTQPTDKDYMAGVVYWLQNGLERVTQIQSPIAAKWFVRHELPVSIVAMVRKNALGSSNDTGYMNTELAKIVTGCLIINNPASLRVAYGATIVDFRVEQIEAVTTKVIDSIYTSERKPDHTKLAAVRINGYVLIEGNPECLTEINCY